MKLMILSLIFLFSFEAYSKTLMVSHKGIWKDHIYAQNTLESLTKALENGFEAIEFDVMLTKDKKLILAHDDSLKKVTNCKGKIHQKLLSQLENCLVTHNTRLPLTQLLVKKVKRPSNMVSLKKVINKLLKDPKLKFVWIDLKGNDPKMISSLKESLFQIDRSLFKKLMINSVDPLLLTSIKKSFAGIRTSLEGKWGSEPLSKRDPFFTGIGSSHDAISLNVGIALGYRGSLNIFIRKRRFWKLLKAYMREAKKRGIPTVAWTVNSKKKMKKLKSFNLDYLLTDLSHPN